MPCRQNPRNDRVRRSHVHGNIRGDPRLVRLELQLLVVLLQLDHQEHDASNYAEIWKYRDGLTEVDLLRIRSRIGGASFALSKRPTSVLSQAVFPIDDYVQVRSDPLLRNVHQELFSFLCHIIKVGALRRIVTVNTGLKQRLSYPDR